MGSLFKNKGHADTNISVPQTNSNIVDLREQRLEILEKLAKDIDAPMQTFQVLATYIQTTMAESLDDKDRILIIASTARETFNKKLGARSDKDSKIFKDTLQHLDDIISSLS